MSVPPDYFNPLVYEGDLPASPGTLPDYPAPGGGFVGYVPPDPIDDGHRYPSLPLSALDFAYYRLGDAYGYVPNDADRDIRGTEVHRADITEVITIWELSYRLRMVMDSTVGDFDFGEIGIYKADGTLLSLFVATELIHKYSAAHPVPNNVVVEATYLYRDDVATSSATWNVYSVGPQGPQGPQGTPGGVEGTTDQLAEGEYNLYYTPERAAAAAPVQAVNGETGLVVLDAEDVGADPVGTAISAASAAIGMHLSDPDPHPQYLNASDSIDGGNF